MLSVWPNGKKDLTIRPTKREIGELGSILDSIKFPPFPFRMELEIKHVVYPVLPG